jgi:hypothetical protein
MGARMDADSVTGIRPHPAMGTEETVSNFENTTGLRHTDIISNAILKKPRLQIHQFLYSCHFWSRLAPSSIFVHGRRRAHAPRMAHVIRSTSLTAV